MNIVVENSTRNTDIAKTSINAIAGVAALVLVIAFKFNYFEYVVGGICLYIAIMLYIGIKEICNPNVVKLETNESWFCITMNKNVICSGNLNDVAGIVTIRNNVVINDSEGNYSIKISRKRIIMKDKVAFDMPMQFNALAKKFEKLIMAS